MSIPFQQGYHSSVLAPSTQAPPGLAYTSNPYNTFTPALGGSVRWTGQNCNPQQPNYEIQNGANSPSRAHYETIPRQQSQASGYNAYTDNSRLQYEACYQSPSSPVRVQAEPSTVKRVSVPNVPSSMGILRQVQNIPQADTKDQRYFLPQTASAPRAYGQPIAQPINQAPQKSRMMESEQLEVEMATLSDLSTLHKALGRSPAEVSKHIQVISLGSSCGVKMTMRRLGLDQATMPFDWMRTKSACVRKWLDEDFSDYLGTSFNKFDILYKGTTDMTIYRTATHSFWHDSIETPETREKLLRRVSRFQQLSIDEGHEIPRQLLFVRSCTNTAEVIDSEEMYSSLQKHFEKNGRKVWLLVLVEHQPWLGPVLHSAFERLLIWTQPLSQAPATGGDAPGPYEEALAWACQRILRDPLGMWPRGEEGVDAWPVVENTKQLVEKGGRMLLDKSEAGTWAGNVVHKSTGEKVVFAAFAGFEDREVAPHLWKAAL